MGRHEKRIDMPQHAHYLEANIYKIYTETPQRKSLIISKIPKSMKLAIKLRLPLGKGQLRCVGVSLVEVSANVCHIIDVDQSKVN